MMKVVVKSSEWLRGYKPTSRLWRLDEDRGCCLGHVCLAAGATKQEMDGTLTPGGLRRDRGISLMPALLNDDQDSTQANSPVCCDMMAVNDDERITDETRTAELIALGKTIGIEFEFLLEA